MVCSEFLKLTAQCDVYELLQITTQYARFFGIQSALYSQWTTSEEQQGARSMARSGIFRRPVHLHATNPGARHIVSVWPRSFVSYTHVFPAEALVKFGSGICHNSARRVSCRPHLGARTYFLSGFLSGGAGFPAEALVNFGRHPAVLTAFLRKRCTIFANFTLTASTTSCTTTRVGTMSSTSSRSQR